jgi:hypothetical protein
MLGTAIPATIAMECSCGLVCKSRTLVSCCALRQYKISKRSLLPNIIQPKQLFTLDTKVLVPPMKKLGKASLKVVKEKKPKHLKRSLADFAEKLEERTTSKKRNRQKKEPEKETRNLL